MLRVCTKQDFTKYADFAYSLAVIPAKSGYPTYCDGIKTKEMFLDGAQKAFTRGNEEILLFEQEGTVEGWIHYYALPEDRYLSTVSFNIRSGTQEALREFVDFAEEKFKGFDLFLGYPKDNQDAVEYLSTHGFNCIEEDYNNTAFLDRYEPLQENEDVIRISKENYASFEKLHTLAAPDIYWNAERILADIENWIIFAMVRNGEVLGSVYCMDADDGWFEIFGIDLKENVWNPEVFRALVIQALNEVKRRGGKYMTFFCDEECQEIVREIGFKCVGEYVCYKKSLV